MSAGTLGTMVEILMTRMKELEARVEFLEQRDRVIPLTSYYERFSIPPCTTYSIDSSGVEDKVDD